MSNHSNQQTRPTLLKRKRQSSDDLDMPNCDDVQNIGKHPKNDRDEIFNKDENEENDPSVYEKTKRPNNSNDEWNSGDEASSDGGIVSSEDPDDTGVVHVHSHQTWSNFRCWASFLTPRTERTHALPKLDWADSQEVWDTMCKKDEINLTQRDEDLFKRHPGLLPRMRAILLDWIIEVCEVYKMHRETFHMALDYLDRYLSIVRKEIPKQQLQLLGITCLFIASKIEEIYPPKLEEFAYVTDGACTETEILDKELVILKVLNWNLNPVTSNTWLTVFMQTCASLDKKESKETRQRLCLRPGWGSAKARGPISFLLPQYSALAFMQTAQLLDLILLEENCLKYTYGTMAAAAMYLMYNREKALFVSGIQWSDLESCVRWMTPYAQVLREEPCPSQILAIANGQEAVSKNPDDNTLDDAHTIQIHTVDLNMLEKAQKLSKESKSMEILDISLNSPPPSTYPGCLTPPSSHKKSPSKNNFDQDAESESDTSTTTILNNSSSSTLTALSNDTLV